MKFLVAFILGVFLIPLWNWSLYYESIYNGSIVSNTWLITIPYSIFCLVLIINEIDKNRENLWK